MSPSASATAAPLAAGAPAPNGNGASSAAHSHLNASAAASNGLRFDTLAIHKGSEPEPATGAIIPSITLATAYRQSTAGISGADGFDYTRFGNPNRNSLEANLAALEGAKHAFAFSSGTAVTTAILSSIPNGSHVVSVADVYGGTHKILTQIVNETNAIKTTFVDLDSNGLKERLTKAITPETKLIWLETPTNPTLRLVDLPLVSQIVKAIDPSIKIAVDGTFMSPYYQNPLSLGADVVSHSATKFLNGHTDVLLGVAVTNDETIAKKLKFVQSSLGAVPSPFDCWLVLRGLKTLPVRMREHGRNALRIAKYLEKHPGIKDVIYPGLPSHPSFALAKKQISPRALRAQVDDGIDIEQGLQYSGMLSFRIDCDPTDPSVGSDVLKELNVITLALSLGGVESLIEQPSTMTHWMVPLEERLALGIGHDLIRLSVGLEDPRDLEEDLDQALTKVLGKSATQPAAETNKKRKADA
ncbi:hypothetical protein BCV69DRAFT_283168 [Microstroma glucosiphilum]|uniref:cystathionine gamma-lyase n=1 Tax=Pseudomicrostroma glucosiphilum TaxID=1684307 RepID=A0A316U4W8_9BASI|nr:hypothetical protein BCV69DRAFT_283168 [Pseudomicrostroma glucosiphilum]PWN20292.1 hypothetical protein BCV69DRAFT_283168 [Pseudomicrostroma glucosiphilum]